MSTLRIRNLSSLVMLLFGISAFAIGVFGLLATDTMLTTFGATTIDGTLRAFGLLASAAATNVGAYYVLAAFTNLKTFYWWTVPFRLFVTVLFIGGAALGGQIPGTFLGIAIWEGLGALATGAALIYERNRGIE